MSLPFSIAEAVDSLSKKYGFGEVQSVKPLVGGTTQANYLLRASSGNFIIRFYLTRSEEYVRFEVDALRQLAAVHFECQRPVADFRGRFIGRYDDKPFVVFWYIEGEHNTSEGNHVQVASAIARMHTLSQSMRFNCSDSRNSYDQHSCLRTATSNLSNHDSGVESRLSFEWLRREIDGLDLPVGMPKGLCHCDLNPTNFLYRNGLLTGVLDFDMAAHTEMLYDVANLLYWWANPAMDGLHWQERAQEALFAYQQLRPLTSSEKTHLFDMLKLVFLTSIAWFIHLPNETTFDRRGVDALNQLGALAFGERLFGSAYQSL